jgi:hypothetical protein
MSLSPESILDSYVAGLLTCSALTPSHSDRIGTVAKNVKVCFRTYSNGNCSGFSPDSLLILITQGATKTK